MLEVFHKIVKMAYCRKCGGKHMADVEVTAKEYGPDNTFISYKTLSCPCYGQPKAHNPINPVGPDGSKQGTQMQIL